MPILEIDFSKILFCLALSFAVLALFYSFGYDLLKSARTKINCSENSITKKQVNKYFIELGYIVCKVTAVENSHKWYVFLIKNGEYEVATVFTNGSEIEGHKFSIA